MINRFYSKYNFAVVCLILSGYLFLFGYNITHYHIYDINFDTNRYLKENFESKSASKHTTYPGFECPVHSTYLSVHNTLVNAQDSKTFLITEIELLKFYSQQFYFNNQFFSSNLLRAPPSSIS